MRRLLGSLTIALALGACAPSVTEPQLGAQPPGAYLPAPFPPPAARPELVPKRPADDAVWIDGEWRWRGRRWAWVQGRWTRPPAPGAVFARWSSRRDEDGQFYYAPGVWRSAGGEVLPHPAILARSAATWGEGTPEPEGQSSQP